MAFTRRQVPVIQAFGGSTDYRELAYGSNVTAGDLLILIGSYYNDVTWTVTDSQGNDWVQVGTGVVETVNTGLHVWYAIAGTTGPCTVRITPSGNVYLTYAIHNYVGVDSGTPVRDSGSNSSGTAVTTFPSGTVTPSAGDLVLAAVMWTGATFDSLTSSSPFVDQAQHLNGSADEALASAHILDAAGTDETDTFTPVGGPGQCIYASLTVVFAASGGAPPDPLVAGTSSLVSSGPAGIALTATDATGGTSPYTYQWQRNEDGGTYTDLANGGGVSGATTLDLTDGSATDPDILYGYKCVYTDDVLASEESNVLTARVYQGGQLGGGGLALIGPGGLCS